MSGRPVDRPGPIPVLLCVLVVFLALVTGVGAGNRAATEPRGTFAYGPGGAPSKAAPAPQPGARAGASTGSTPTLPGGRTRIFDGRFLVAYYGTAQTSSLGVLGEGRPGRMTKRLVRAARPFHRPGQQPQIVYELIASVVDRHPGRDGSYSHEIPRRFVREYIRLAHRHDALLVLDVQPGRRGFLTVARRWAWALKDPWVGLALDPEWRMHGRQVPGRVFGHVSAAEVNRTTAWLEAFTVRNNLPEKLLVLHQFRTDMVRHIGRIEPRPHLATVQHVDGFGPPRAKLATYHRVARPGRFRMGFKLFYDEDRPLMSAAQVLRIRPRVDFVSFQ